MTSNGNHSETASFSVNFSLPRETIREYFDGLARVEAAKSAGRSLFNADTLSTAWKTWTILSPFVASYIGLNDKADIRFGSRKPTESDLKNIVSCLAQGGWFNDSESSEESDDSDIEDLDDDDVPPPLINADPVSSTQTECEVDISEVAHGTQIKTIIEMLSTASAGEKELLDQAISALQFMRDHPADKSDKSLKGKSKKQKSEVCATGVCEVVKEPKDDKAAGAASSVEDSFQPDLKPAKKSKVIVKPKYQPEEALAVGSLADMAKNMFGMFGIDQNSEQGKLFQQIASSIAIGTQNSPDLGSLFNTAAKLAEKDTKDSKDEVKEVKQDLKEEKETKEIKEEKK